jgi:hypothetical protein
VARAGRLGEGGGRRLLATLQAAAPAGTGFHLMGHGFGCVAVSAMLTGDQPGPVAPVRSLVLVQGTLSAFAFCARDPAGPGRPGRNLLDGEELPPKASRELDEGSVVTVVTPGGGGTGQADPGRDAARGGGASG